MDLMILEGNEEDVYNLKAFGGENMLYSYLEIDYIGFREFMDIKARFSMPVTRIAANTHFLQLRPS